MESKTFKVPNIGCDGCVKAVRSEIEQVAGVVSVDVKKDEKLVSVQWNNPASWEAIRKALVDIDYAPAEA
jgi:copper chaperone